MRLKGPKKVFVKVDENGVVIEAVVDKKFLVEGDIVCVFGERDKIGVVNDKGQIKDPK